MARAHDRNAHTAIRAAIDSKTGGHHRIVMYSASCPAASAATTPDSRCLVSWHSVLRQAKAASPWPMDENASMNAASNATK